MEHWLTKRAYLTPDNIAIELSNGETLTFAQLYERACAFASKVYTVHQNGHIAMLSNNSIDMVVAFWACTYLNVPVVFLNTRLTTREWQIQCEDADVETVIYADQYKESVESLALPTYPFADIDTFKSSACTLTTDMDLNSVCSLMFTSGTTGRAKPVIHTYHNHWSSAVASALNLGLMPNDKWLACLPLFHIGGLSILFKSVIYGMPVYLLERFDEEKVHNAIMNQDVTIISVVAVTCSRLLDRLADGYYPSSFRCMLLGGGPAPKPLLEKAKEKNVPIVQTYGMTETSSQIVTLSEADALRKLGSAGKPLFSASLQIHANNKTTKPNEVGEIVVKGPMVTSGYYHREKANKEAFRNGWFHTGDLGYVDEEGFLFVVDRRSDLIISGGENIYPAEVEEVLLSFKGVQEAGVTAIEDSKWGQVPVAYVVANEGVTAEQLLVHCSARLASFKVPKTIYFRDQLPRNATNKLQRHLLQS
ncbi:o-succinylbenzoate--CoA ligase [Gracilibacillus thailandensis]|uniref:2-succinylbenzoate--CoA ligase n=1 Tax=Gracilibacillus thailandensis TaxID=563735 RepID=A0A6N7QVT5_9BACI|nr:o-succinylbenzoate--CoA ligase [Gracilibacillus thailandensis]MRI65644.1 o-succinylbenzoate--CoA ligase [Gracilibacillus thailandensis]